MKRLSIIGLGVITALSLVPLNGAPLIAKAFDAGRTMAGNVARQPKVQLKLVAEKQVMQFDSSGKTKTTWQGLNTGNSLVNPGDVIRYSAKGINEGNNAANNVAITQPIPKGTVYVLGSAIAQNAQQTTTTYSIDGGKTFVEKPLVQVKSPDGKVWLQPAPAEAYTHLRWTLKQALTPGAIAEIGYQVKVR